MYRLIALDLDDTLLTHDKQVSSRNRSALKACLDKGIRVVSASGRFNESQLALIKRIGLGLEHQYHVGDGGGTIFNDVEILCTMGSLAHSDYAAILQQVRKLKLPCFVTNGENVYYDIADQPLRGIYSNGPDTRRPYIYEVEDLLTVENPMKFVFSYDTEEVYERIRSIKCKGTMTFHAGRNLMEITSEKLNKFDALKRLGKLYDIRYEEMICIGDSENDIPMLKGAGLGLAVANALDTVKAVADVVGEKTNDEDGVAWLLEHCGIL